MRGSPIRTPSDQRSVGSSPRLIAASHVLHRLLMPRHPPYALNNLTNTQNKHSTKTSRHHQKAMRPAKRCSRPLCSSQPTNSHRPSHHRQTPGRPRAVRQTNRPCVEEACPLPQDPTACLRNPTRIGPRSTHPRGAVLAGRPRPEAPNWSAFHPRALSRTPAATREWATVTVRAQLWTTPNEGRGQCSLERR